MCLNPLSGSLNLATMGKRGDSLPALWAPWLCLAKAVGPREANRDRGGVNDKWDEDRWVRKRGGKREEVACGSVIECRSGLSWWGGGDDKAEWRAGVFREDYKAFGSLMSPVGWPQGTSHITCFPILVCLISFHVAVIVSVIPGTNSSRE